MRSELDGTVDRQAFHSRRTRGASTGGRGWAARLVAGAVVAAALVGCSRTGLWLGGEGGEGGADNREPPVFPACVKDSAELVIPRLAVNILFDTSKSMSWSGQWEGATAALASFFGDPQNGGLNVALRLFPAATCNASTCDPVGCAHPTVDAAPLMEAAAPSDPQEAALVAALKATTPAGNTPMYPAMEGAFRWAENYRAATEGNTAAVVLVTDGEPSGCNNHVNDLVELVEGAFASGTKTFVVGLAGTNQMVDDRIAQAGGSETAYMVGLEDTANELAATLDAIRDAALVCSYRVPPSLGAIDPPTTNVASVAPNGAVSNVPRVESGAACGTASGWYFETTVEPRIALCPASCRAAQKGDTRRLFVTQGCTSAE